MNYEHDDRPGTSDKNQTPYEQKPVAPRRPRPVRKPENEMGRAVPRRGAAQRSETSRIPRRSVSQETARIRERADQRQVPRRRPDNRQRTAGAERKEVSSGQSAARQTAASRTGTAAKTRRTASAGMAQTTPREALAEAKIARAKQKKRRRRIIAMIIAECFTLMLIFGYGYFARRWNLIQRQDFKPQDVQNKELSVDDLTKMKGYRMIAVFGVDSRDTNVGTGVQSDVNIICCINQDTGEIKLVSLYRDTYLNINDSNSYRKFNAAYNNGGPEQALKALNKNLDLDITEYITFSWKSVAEGINILGGVDVEITKPEFRYINGFITETVKATGIGSHQLKEPGLQHLDGVQAVAYGRLRLMDTDYARTERQRKVIELAFAKAKQADYTVLNNILETILPNISTNLTFADMTSMALGIGKYHIGETAGFPFAKGNVTIPGKGDCVIPQTLESNVSQLHVFLFGDEDYTPTNQVKQISSKIAEDSGMYKEGKPSTGSALATDSYVPPETTRAAVTEEETTPQESESDEEGRISEPETDESGRVIITYPGETDEDGNLIDGPIDDWPEGPDDPYLGGQNGPSNPGTVNPTQPSGGRVPVTPGGETSESSEGRIPGQTGETGPGMNPTGPGTTQQTGANPSGTVTPGGDSPGGSSTGNSTFPGGNTNEEPGGPGSIQNNEGPQEPGGGSPAGDPSSQNGPGGSQGPGL